MLLSAVRRVEAPDDYWAQVLASALADDRLTFDEYRLVEHPYVEQWWERHWDLAEPLLEVYELVMNAASSDMSVDQIAALLHRLHHED